MKILLTEDVMGLGDIGETVKVRPGYARNFLIPRGLAIETQSANARATQHRIRQIESKKRRLRSGAEGEKQKLESAAVILELRVGSGGKVFGSVGARDIAEKLATLGFEVDRRRVLLVEPIRKIGSHPVRVKLHPEVIAEVNVTINPTAASRDEEEQETQEARAAMERARASEVDTAALEEEEEETGALEA